MFPAPSSHCQKSSPEPSGMSELVVVAATTGAAASHTGGAGREGGVRKEAGYQNPSDVCPQQQMNHLPRLPTTQIRQKRELRSNCSRVDYLLRCCKDRACSCLGHQHFHGPTIIAH